MTTMSQRNTRPPLLNNPPIPLNTRTQNLQNPEQAYNTAQFNNMYPKRPPPQPPIVTSYRNTGYNTYEVGMNNTNFPQPPANTHQNTGYNPNPNNVDFLSQRRTPYNNR